jgi:uncharacterized protein
MPVDVVERILLYGNLGTPVSTPNWLIQAHAIFCQSLLDRAYPCYLGTAAEKLGELLITYVEGDKREHLPQTLSSFLQISAVHPNRRHVLALFYKPEIEPRSLGYYKTKFWDLLQFLHDNDPSPWPEGQPSDPHDPCWEFVFDGTAMFVFEAAPAYKLRRSRNLGPGMIVLFQPRQVFNDIEGGTPAGIKTRKRIRERMELWDQMEAHPDMGSYGDLSNHEWKQYFLPDDNTPVTEQCPLHLRMQAQELNNGQDKSNGRFCPYIGQDRSNGRLHLNAEQQL